MMARLGMRDDGGTGDDGGVRSCLPVKPIEPGDGSNSERGGEK